MTSSSTLTGYVRISWRAGPRTTLPVRTLNWAPCQGQVRISPSSSPSFSGPLIWVQLSVKAHTSPFTRARQMGSPSTSTANSAPSSNSSTFATLIKSVIIVVVVWFLNAGKGETAVQHAQAEKSALCACRTDGDAQRIQDIIFAKLGYLLYWFALDHL